MAILPRNELLSRFPSDEKAAELLSSDLLTQLNDLVQTNAVVLELLRAQETKTEKAFEEMKSQLHLLGIHQLQVTLSPPLQACWAFQLVSFPTIPLYIKRKFDIQFRLIEASSQPVDFQQPLYCMLAILTMSSNAEEVTQTRSGKPILRGQLTRGFKPKENLRYQGLVFWDISGPFPQGRVNLWIRCVNCEAIRPLMIEGVRVKARKKTLKRRFNMLGLHSCHRKVSAQLIEAILFSLVSLRRRKHKLPRLRDQ